MRFFSVFDIVTNKAMKNDETITEMYAKFRKMGIKKVELDSLKDNGMLPTENILESVLHYLDLTKLELELMLGRIPVGYEQTYLEKIKEIATLLELNDSNDTSLTTPTVKPYFTSDYGKLYNGDCLQLLRMIPDESVDLVFADPPFNLDKEYDDGVNDSKSYSSYIAWCIEWLDECVRVLKPNGSLFIYNIPKWHTYLASHLNNNLKFWDWISVDMKFSLPIQNRLYPAHYSLLYYVKGNKPKTFNSQRIPLQTCRHCGGDLKDYGGYKNKMNPSGVNVSDVWTDIYPVRHKSSKNRKFNELPVKLLDRVITMSTNENDIVLDPFGGSGTTFVVSEMLKRKWIGFELGNCDIIRERLENKANDIELLKKVYEEKNMLFPEKVKQLRKKNGLWLAEDFLQEEDTEGIEQLLML